MKTKNKSPSIEMKNQSKLLTNNQLSNQKKEKFYVHSI